MNKFLEIRDLKKSYASGGGRLEILTGLSLDADAGDMIGITGVSGSGKSTLLHLIGGMDKRDAGSIRIQEQEITELRADDLAVFRNKTIGFLFQFHHLLPEFTTEENVAMQAIIAGSPRSQALDLARGVLDRVGLANRTRHRVTTLSGGERQRAAIARAVLARPRVLLADEPTGNLDDRTGKLIGNLLLELNQDLGMTLIVATHNRELAGTMGRCLELRSGELYEETRDRSHCTGIVMHGMADGGISRTGCAGREQ